MTAIFVDRGGNEISSLERFHLLREEGWDGRWLQALLFRHPGLIPMEQIEFGAGPLIPIAREVSLPRSGSSLFIDLLGVMSSGRLVIVECKPWRNPEARRQVVAQVLEYAALLRGWSFASLTTHLKHTKGMTGPNPLYALAATRVSPLDEARFVDGVSRSLAAGDFHLVIVGDGIRSDLQTLAGHLNDSGAGAARLSLVEIQLWRDQAGQTMLLPTVPLRTEVITQRVIVGDQGLPLRIEPAPAFEDAPEAAAVDPDKAARVAANRAFWQRFINEVRFEHPDQPPPRHGGDNWVRLSLPPPAKSMSLYRTANGEVGLYMMLQGEAGASLFETLQSNAEATRAKTRLPVTFDTRQSDPFEGVIATKSQFKIGADDQQFAWLKDAANKIVGAVRVSVTA